MRNWNNNNPRELHEKPLHSERVSMWCALSRERNIGPYFFEDNEHAATVNSERYVNMIDNFFLPTLREIDIRIWFQQDGATAHTARNAIRVLRENWAQRRGQHARLI